MWRFGDLLFEFNDRTRMVISAGLDREGATDVYSGICRSVGAKTSQLNEVLYEYAILR